MAADRRGGEMIHARGGLRRRAPETGDWFEEIPRCAAGHVCIPDPPRHGMALARGAIEKYRAADW